MPIDHENDYSELNLPERASTNLPISERNFLIGMNPHIQQFNNPDLTDEEYEQYLNEAFELGKSCMELYPKWPAIKWTQATSDTYPKQLQLFRSLGWISIIYIDIAEYYLEGTAWKIKPLLQSGMNEDLAYNDSTFVSAVSSNLKTFIHSADPNIIMIGNEINQIYELNGLEAYKEFVSAVEDIADNVHAAYPDVLIGTTLSHTQMLIDISDNTPWSQNRLFLLNYIHIDKLDCVGINSYPFKEGYNNPKDIPTNHYKSLETYLGEMPIIFSEIAWPSGADYQSSESEQDDFLIKFLDITVNQDMNIYGILWFTMHDFYKPTGETGGGNYQKSWGLRDVNSNPKQIWETWMELKALNITGTMNQRYLDATSTGEESSGLTMAHLSLIAIIAIVIIGLILFIRRKRKNS